MVWFSFPPSCFPNSVWKVKGRVLPVQAWCATMETLALYGGLGGLGFQEGLGQEARQEGAGSSWKDSPEAWEPPHQQLASPSRPGEPATLPGTCRAEGRVGAEAHCLQALRVELWTGLGGETATRRLSPGRLWWRVTLPGPMQEDCHCLTPA